MSLHSNRSPNLDSIGYVSCYCNKISGWSHLKEGRIHFGSQFECTSTEVGSHGDKRHKATGPIPSIVKFREWGLAGWFSTLSLTLEFNSVTPVKIKEENRLNRNVLWLPLIICAQCALVCVCVRAHVPGCECTCTHIVINSFQKKQRESDALYTALYFSFLQSGTPAYRPELPTFRVVLPISTQSR